MEESGSKSLWQTEKAPEFPKFNGSGAARVVIVGGGICGLLCAYELLRGGEKDIVVLEARKICGGTTAHTTGKITALHGLFYQKLLDVFGEGAAREYAAANRDAIEEYRRIVQREGIGCDLAPCSAYTYALDEEGAKRVEAEAQAARRASLDARVVHDCELPFPIRSAVMLEDQARFHPLKFCYRLAGLLQREGVKIYEDSGAVDLEDGTVCLRDGSVHGRSVVICTHYPYVNFRGLYFARIIQRRSYVAALEGAPKLDGMYLDCADAGDSFRSQEWQGGSLILLGRFDHKSGHETGTAHYELLEQEAQRLYPGCRVKFRWSAQDCETADGLPYVGRYRQMRGNVYLATGFRKWGMTGSMAAAQRLSRMILSGEEKAPAFSPERSDFSAQAGTIARETADTAANFLHGYFEVPPRSVSELENGRGGLAEYGGGRIGAYRDEDGGLHGVNPVCPHMGCPLKWNAEERTWDCPCHGSRFDLQGRVIEGPACRGLDRRGPE